MINNLKKAYSLLADDLSREIFINRLGFMAASQKFAISGRSM